MSRRVRDGARADAGSDGDDEADEEWAPLTAPRSPRGEALPRSPLAAPRPAAAGGGRRCSTFNARVLGLAAALGLLVIVVVAWTPEYREALQNKSNEMMASIQASLTPGNTDVAGPAPSMAPTRQYLEETRHHDAKPAWTDKAEGKRMFKEQSGTCYFKNIIRRVNNRPGHHLNCYAACTGINLRLRADQANRECVGWTMVKRITCDELHEDAEACNQFKVGSNTCLLHHRFETDGSYESSACVSGKLLSKDLVLGKNGRNPYPVETNSTDFDDGGDDETLENATSATGGQTAIVQEDFARTCPARHAAVGDAKRPLRVFVACLQSSGCTLLSYLLAQRDRTASILDVGVRQDLPAASFYGFAERAYPSVDTIVLKYPMRGVEAMSPDAWIRQVQAKYKPDVTLLYLRNPVDMFLHLINHIGPSFAGKIPSDEDLAHCTALQGDDSYGLACGSPESKLRAINQLYRQRSELGINAVVRFEDICDDRAILQETLESAGICINEEDLRQPKWSIVDVMRFSLKYFPSGKSKGGVFWGPGNLRNTFHTKSGDRETEERAYRLCKKELSTNVRIKLLSFSVSPFTEMTLSDIEAVVSKAAPDLVTAYKE